MNLLGRTKIVQSVAPVTSNTALTETAIDCTGFDRVCHIINVGAMTATGTCFNTLRNYTPLKPQIQGFFGHYTPIMPDMGCR